MQALTADALLGRYTLRAMRVRKKRNKEGKNGKQNNEWCFRCYLSVHCLPPWIDAAGCAAGITWKSYVKSAPEQSLWKRKERSFVFMVTSCPLYLFARFYSMGVNGPRLWGGLSWPHRMPGSMAYHGKRSQKFWTWDWSTCPSSSSQGVGSSSSEGSCRSSSSRGTWRQDE